MRKRGPRRKLPRPGNGLLLFLFILIAVVGIAASGAGNHLSSGGFHEAMLIAAVLLVAGGLTGAVGIRNAAP